MSVKNYFLYVGPHRSGSTFLQTYIFPNIENVYVPFRDDPMFNYRIQSEMDAHPMYVDIPGLRRELNKRLEGVKAENVVISDEEFFGDYGHYNSDGNYIIEPFHNHQNRAQFLAKLYPEAKVILSPRRQDHWVQSAYMHFVQNYATVSIDEFLHRTTDAQKKPYAFHSRLPGVNYQRLHWLQYIENYGELFGHKNVLVVPQDMVAQDLNMAMDRLAAFMEVAPYYPKTVPQPGLSLSNRALRLLLLLSPFVSYSGHRVGIIPAKPFSSKLKEMRAKKDNKLLWALAGISRRLDLYWFLGNVVDRFMYKRPDVLGPENRKMILDYYREHNIEYAKTIDLDLEKYGYF